ncbi:MAG TPA: xanthine dehydrogenase family protein molybdopterin-binding subunit, partial [Candidatus Thioglobus sp.]|nr:xanthine dehydrogenase family protein molybdopterin-binding subunit [Candidatus Thioglobus sp.]
GKTIYGIDIRLPSMLYATVVHPPVFGASVKSFNDREAKKVPGVKKVFKVSLGLAVVAKNTWSAFKGAKALEIKWDNGNFNMDSKDISKSFQDLARKKGVVAREDGDVEKAMKKAKKHIEAIYEVPYLAHATMEPMNCTAHVLKDYCELWAPTQNPQGAQRTAMQLTGFSKDKVKVHVTQLGCGLGRRSSSDFIQDSVEIAMNVDVPVKLIWTREEDMQHDFYRPSTYNLFEAGLDEAGKPLAWNHRVVASPLRGGSANTLDRSAVDGASNLPYDIPNIYVDYCRSDLAVPVGYWRSVGPSQNTFITESFIDEIAHAAEKDPFEYRKKLLKNHPRLLNVLELAAEKSGWGKKLLAGHTMGIAVVEDKGSVCAQVAEISIEQSQVQIHRIVCALDCGQVIHPGIVESQTVGSVVFGLTAALYGEINIKKGRVVQSNFHDYPLLGIHEMPDVEVYLVDSNDEPGGAGEPAVPPVAPAVTNAIFAATGKRIRSLPIKSKDLKV